VFRGGLSAKRNAGESTGDRAEFFGGGGGGLEMSCLDGTGGAIWEVSSSNCIDSREYSDILVLGSSSGCEYMEDEANEGSLTCLILLLAPRPTGRRGIDVFTDMICESGCVERESVNLVKMRK